MANWYNELSKINVNDHVEKKNGLSYLSWAYAWDILKSKYPLSYETVYEAPDGGLVFKDPIGGHVKTGVTLVWEENGELKSHEAIEYLPIMDNRNKSVLVENMDSMTIYKTIQRSKTKCIARLGLGMYIYAGEDLPIENQEEKAEKEKNAALAKEEVSKLVSAIDDVIMPIIKDKSKEERVVFCNEVIVPIIGKPNYKTCTDVAKLQQLMCKLA